MQVRYHFFPWIIVLLLFLVVFLIPEIKIENMEPVFENDVKPILKGTYNHLGLPYLELIIFLMITPYVTKQNKMRRSYYQGMLIGGGILAILMIFCLLVLGVTTTSIQSYPTYSLGKRINVAKFLDRVEVMITFIWVITVYFKLTICFYGLSLGLAQVLNLKSYQILLFPLASLILSFTLFLYPDIVFFNEFTQKAYTPLSLLIGFVLPLLVLVTGKWKNKFG